VDVVVFDREHVRETGRYLDPLHLAEGMAHVWVNREFEIRDGEFTGALPGRILRRHPR
jgi:N-acyl-D-amino-acid deacylase